MSAVSCINSKFGRGRFAVRLAIFLLVGTTVLVAAKVGLVVLTARAVSSHWPIYLFHLAEVIGALGLLAIAAFNAYVFVVRGALPRLSDMGLYGPVRSWAAVLAFAYPVSILILFCMLVTPSNFIPRK